MLIYNIMVAFYAISFFISVLAIFLLYSDKVTYELYQSKLFKLDVLTLLISLIASFYA